MQPIRILIVDDHYIVRLGLRIIVDGARDIELIGEASNGEDAERLVASLKADLLVLDISMPGKSGIQVLQSLRSKGYSIPILFFSMYTSTQFAEFAKRNGAQGFIDKGKDGAEMLRAIRQIVGGGAYFPALASLPDTEEGPFASLSRREREVLTGVLRGKSLQAIAETLGIGPKSVSTYRRRLLDKLGVESNAELAAMAARFPNYDFCLSVDADRQTQWHSA